MTEQLSVLTANGTSPGVTTATMVRTFRVLTANVQSFPRDAITLEQARADLRANAADGDLVLLQEIDSRYRPLVRDEFPASDWHVFFGPDANHSPIAARRTVFDLLGEDTVQVHPGVEKVHEPRFLTRVHLRHRDLGVELHAVNLHLVSGAFKNPPKADAAFRQKEWHEGMRTHDEVVARLVATGAPVVGGGDYNRRLRAFRPQVKLLAAGRPMSFGVDLESIDLVWFIDGRTASWAERGRTIFRGSDGRPPKMRNSDHHARQVTLALTRTTVEVEPTPDPVVIAPDGSSARTGKKKHGSTDKAKDKGKGAAKAKANARDKDKGKDKQLASFAPHPQSTGMVVPGLLPPGMVPFAGPPDRPFEITTFGDKVPKVVDWKTRAALEEAERLLGYPLTVVQGCYNNGRVKASGPTHDGGGVVDLLAWDWRRKLTVLREIGFAAWHRTRLPGVWDEHIHAVLIEHGKLDPSAARQVASYLAGRDGLKRNLVDPFPRPNPVRVFRYPPAPIDLTADGRRDRSVVEPLGRAFPPRRTLDGVDISHHQSQRLDLTAAKAAGVRWMYVKATEGATLKDKTHKRRVRQARASGIPVGAYHFARPEGRDAAQEAKFFLSTIDLRAGDLVPMLDLEDDGDLTLAQLTEWTGTWVRTVEREIRRKGLTGKPVIYTRFNLIRGFGCLLWVARYSDDFRPPAIPRPWKRAAIWQHSNGKLGPVKSVPGIGRVDVNTLHPDLPLSALRLRPVRAGAKQGPGTKATPVVLELPVAAAEAVAPVGTAAGSSGDLHSVVALAKDRPAPTVTTTTTQGEPGSIVITVTVPMPATPEPLHVFPDLGPLEEQLANTARSLQGAIEAIPERPEP